MISKINIVIIGGQAIWAAAQAATILLLSHLGGIETVGIYTLGLATFTPISLIGSLNLRTILAIDFNQKINLKAAYKARSITILISLAITSVITFLASNSSKEWLPAFLLVACRSVDLISDITTGHFQRTKNHKLISLSLTARGLASIAPLILASKIGYSLTTAAIYTLITTIAITLFIDILPIIRNLKESIIDSSIKSLLKNLKEEKWSIPFPFIDSINSNSLRYAVITTASTSLLGVVGIAQTLFVPIQLIITSIGYTHLTNIRTLVQNKQWEKISKENAKGMMIGISINALFIVASFAVPEIIIEKITSHSGHEIKTILTLVGIAMLPTSMTSLLGHTLLASGANAHYSTSPLVGLICFWSLFLALSYLSKSTSENINWIFYLYLVSNTIRLLYTYISIKKYLNKLSNTTKNI